MPTIRPRRFDLNHDCDVMFCNDYATFCNKLDILRITQLPVTSKSSQLICVKATGPQSTYKWPIRANECSAADAEYADQIE